MKKRRVTPPRPASCTSTLQPTTRTLAVIAAALVLLGVLVYANSLSNPFILDDQRAVVENPQIRSVWPLTESLSPPDETPVARRPLVNLTFALNYAAHGLDVEGYHLGNLAIHVLSALVLFGLVRRTLGIGELARWFGERSTHVAALCAIVWMVHPLHTEIVNYVSQRTTALMGLFYLLTLYCSIRALRPGSFWRAAAVAACAAGMACKESMVTAPLLVLLFDRAFVFGSFRQAIRERRSLYIGLLATWGLLFAFMVSGSRTTVGFDAGVSVWTYLLNQALLLLHYLRLVFWPHELVVDYGMTVAVDVADGQRASVIIAALLVGSLAAAARFRRAGFLCVSIFVLLAPTSSVVPIASEVGAERRMYLPLAAIAVLIVCLAYRGALALRGTAVIAAAASTAPTIGANLTAGRRAIWATAAWTLAAAVCASLSARTVLRNGEYASPLTLAQITVERRPHGRAYYTLGTELFDAGRRAEAIVNFRRAAQDFVPARFALGSELLADGQLEAGMEQLRTFADSLPDHPAAAGARQMIATALAERGKYDEAITELQLVLRVEPSNSRAHAFMGQLLLFDPGRRDEAIRHFQRAVMLDPRSARTRDLLGNALALDGRFDEAATQFSLAVQIDPAHSAARASLAKLSELNRSADGRVYPR